LIQALLEDHNGDIWAAGTSLFRVKGQLAEALRPPIAISQIRAISEDAEKRMYFGQLSGGLLRLAGTNWSRFNRSAGLPSDSNCSL
jgi:ligand-binding sensor domain-containing protein